jgi:hypothetical protein
MSSGAGSTLDSVLTFPAQAGTHLCYGCRPSPAWQVLGDIGQMPSIRKVENLFAPPAASPWRRCKQPPQPRDIQPVIGDC